MSNSVTRRSMLSLAALGIASMAAPVFAQSVLSIPAVPMRLSRTLVRSLRDGKHISVRRDWIIAFERFDAKIAVTGRQDGVSVDAPAKLEALARLEEQRDTNTMFPIFLSDRGQILTAGSGKDAAMVADAFAAGEALIASSAQGRGNAQSAAEGLAKLRAAGKGFFSAMPEDLFFPAGEEFHRRQDLVLDDGTTGTLEVSYAASTSPSSPWLLSAERRVATTIGTDRRVSRELWSLDAA